MQGIIDGANFFVGKFVADVVIFLGLSGLVLAVVYCMVAYVHLRNFLKRKK